MRTFARDSETNDITFGYYASKTSGNVIKDTDVVSGKEGVLSIIEAIVKTERGELSLDTGAGIDHIGLLANGSNLLPFWRKDMEDAVSGCGYVTAIRSFDVTMDRDSASVKYTLEIDTDEGVVTENGVTAKLARVSRYGYAPKV